MIDDYSGVPTVHYFGRTVDLEYSSGAIRKEVPIKTAFEYLGALVCDHAFSVSGRYHKGPIPFVGPEETARRERDAV